MGARLLDPMPLMCVWWQTLVRPTDSVPGFIWAETESGGAAPLCGEPAGELEWKTQLSVRLGAGWEVRASLPALPLGAERGALLSEALGGGGIDQGQGSHVIKGGPGIKGALPKESRMAPENPRPRTPLVSSAGLYTREVRNSYYKIYKKMLLHPRIAFQEGFRRGRDFKGGGVESIPLLASAKNSEPSGRDTTCLPFFFFFFFLRKNNSLKSSLYESGHLKDRTLATLVSHLSFPMGIFPF